MPEIKIKIDCGETTCQGCGRNRVILNNDGSYQCMACAVFNKNLTVNGYSFNRLPECLEAGGPHKKSNLDKIVK